LGSPGQQVVPAGQQLPKVPLQQTSALPQQKLPPAIGPAMMWQHCSLQQVPCSGPLVNMQAMPG
jgi:hypothetical protein